MSPKLSIVVSLLAAAAAIAPARAQCPQWTGGFELPGADGEVRAFTVFDDGSGPALYFGGDFRHIGAVAVNAVGRWNGVNWSDVGVGLGLGTLGGVYALQAFDDGSGPKLYAAGYITSPAYGLARWNGASWSGVGSGLNYGTGAGVNLSRAFSLTVHDDGSGPALFVGGRFDRAGGNPAHSIAKWNGVGWSALAQGLDSAVSSDVGECYSFATYDDGSGVELYVAGHFGVSGVIGAKGLAKWNGTSWSAVGAGNPSVAQVLAVYDDGSGLALYVGGGFQTIGGVTAHGLARWDGIDWSEVGSGLSTGASPYAGVGALAAIDLGSGPALYVGGSFDHAGGVFAPSVARWNGAWSALDGGLYLSGGPAHPSVFASFDAGAGPRLITGGSFDRAGDHGALNLATWDGTEWSQTVAGEGASAAVDALLSVDSGPDGRALYAAGAFTSIGSAATSGVARWDGTRWHALDLGLGGEATALGVFDSGAGPELYVGGLFSYAGTSPAAHVARWDGVQWSALGSGTDGRVNAFAVFDDGSGAALYAGGNFSLAGGIAANNIARWNGATWSAVGSGTTTLGGHTVDALAVFDDGSGPALYVGGRFDSAGGVANTLNLARWSASGWSSVGGANARIAAFAVHNDGTGEALYAAGDFLTIGGASAKRIARWNGASWSALGTGASARVYALTSFAVQPGMPAQLFAGGDPGSFGGLPSRRVARWDGTAWLDLGGNVSDLLFALASFDDPTTPWRELYLGGVFASANNAQSQGIARWVNPCACQATSYCTAGTTSNGCVPTISGIGAASATATSGFTIRIDQVEGQKQGHIAYSISGANANPWSPLSSSFLCIKAPTQRTPTQNSNGTNGACDGVMSIDWNDYIATHPGALGTPLVAGTQVWAQLYFRDPPAPKTTNLSDGLTFYVCP